MVRTRIAPSPTGFFHIGTARTALFNYLFAKKNNGSFIVRIEDTDKERSKPEFERDILEGLTWLGMQWDEGPDKKGEYGPYHQSERFALYRRYLEELNNKSLLYKCYCTKEELEEEREMQVLSRQPPRYSGKCSARTAAEQHALEKEGRTSTLRFRIERNRKLTIKDHIRGDLTFDTDILDDFIIAKDFDTPLYNFAVVIDDHLMKISHIIRGEEHISNVPKQALLAEALDFSTPEFAHLPLILNPDRTKLSKRQNKVSLLEYRTDGYLSEALINFMVLLGWNPGGDREIFTLAELEEIFDLTRVNKSGSIFDTHKLDWFNAHYIREMDISKLTSLCTPYFISAGYLTEKEASAKHEDAKIEKIVDLERERIHKISEIPLHTSYFFLTDVEYDDHLLLWKNTSPQATQEGLRIAEKVLLSLDESDFTASKIEQKLKQAIVEGKLKNGVVLWPLRVSLTGLAASPSPFDVAAILGKKKTLERVSHALKRISSLRP
ncbi:glutamate--tRNA ligase [Candidatus Uhrbacteria bacterium]|nr:glutamate--tRNA ligase [Candidatus Uhrbacteria bacterium]